MNNTTKRVVGISLIVSAITVLFTLLVAPSKSKRGSRILGILAILEGLSGLFIVTEEPRRRLRKKRIDALSEDDELFDEDEADDAVEVIDSELSHTNENESGAPSLKIEIPCDEDACEEDFI